MSHGDIDGVICRHESDFLGSEALAVGAEALAKLLQTLAYLLSSLLIILYRWSR